MQTDERLRFSRHLALAGFDESNQRKLSDSSILLIGLGGLGCPVASYLVASGVGGITICDFDRVDASNLHRQLLYAESDIGRPKAEAAVERLAALNAGVNIRPTEKRLQGEELFAEVRGVDLVIDCSDNFGTRFEINRACIATGTTLITGAAIRLEGQVAVLNLRHRGGPCYQCLYPESGGDLEDCQGQGILGPVTGVIGGMVAVEALKLLAGLDGGGEPKLHRYNAISGEWKTSHLARDPACPACSTPEEPTGAS